MSCRGVHFAICEDLAKKLLGARNDEERIRIVQDDIEQPWDEEHLFETDKAWDALHRCLSDGTLNVGGGTAPLNLCFFGARVLNEKPGHFIVFIASHEVQQVADALQNATRDWLRERYESTAFPDYQGMKDELDFEYTWDQFQGLPEFFARAGAEGRHVVFTVDQ